MHESVEAVAETDSESWRHVGLGYRERARDESMNVSCSHAVITFMHVSQLEGAR